MERFSGLLTPRRPIVRLVDYGFTIIEILIVLAIAGLIMLIVFLAVPALQRNNRNTQYRTEAGRVLAAAQEFVNNNNATLPVAADSATIASNANTKNFTTLTIQTGNVTAHTFTGTTTAYLDTGVTCGTTSGATVTPAAGPARAMVVMYANETSSGGYAAQCTAS
jgi:prepilin-type N-terminal cleavage/methylation domain-containing protein